MSITDRAKKMLINDMSLGQFIFQSTDTMLPKKHSASMESLLMLFGRGIIIVDVACGSKRSALGFMAPTSELNRWVPDDRYIIQTATQLGNNIQVELVSTDDIGDRDSWELSAKRTHSLNKFPGTHKQRIERITGSATAFQTIWAHMSLVFIWEKNEKDDFQALVEYVDCCAA